MSRRTVAVSALGLVLLLGATACGQADSSSDTRIASCGTPELSWKMTLLPGKPHHTPAATLSATHKGSKSCAFDGYPELDFRVGKGAEAFSKPKTSTPVHLELNPGHSIEFPVFYDPIGSPPGDCEIAAEYDPSVFVTPPHRAREDYGSRLQLTDAKGKHVRAQVCGADDPKLGAPQLH
ncbi:DUF4232 domain-containing protein [Streptomyces sp. NPDC005728]|uniref:DUF4232 domain-containing protein n=1 Tax=Streptomyces sp. NPDC005728 TaxID=3157054 RepID=UPI003405BE2B